MPQSISRDSWRLPLRISRMLKSPPASFSLRSEAQRTEAYASPPRSLRPCWTAFLSILYALFRLPKTCGPSSVMVCQK